MAETEERGMIEEGHHWLTLIIVQRTTAAMEAAAGLPARRKKTRLAGREPKSNEGKYISQYYY